MSHSSTHRAKFALLAGLLCVASAAPAWAQAKAPAPAQTMRGDPEIPDSRFPTFVSFSGNWDNPNTNQARVDAVVSVKEGQFFSAGFFRPTKPTYGALTAWNMVLPNRYGQEYLLISLGMGDMFPITLLHWIGGEHEKTECCGIVNALGPLIKPHQTGYSNGPPAPTGYLLNKWQFVAGVVDGRCGRQIFLDGVWGAKNTDCKPWPTVLSYTTFGSYREGTDTAHPYEGGMRDWAIGTGVPTTEELERMRNGENPATIWGKRLWGYWRFTTDPASRKKEPDLSGNGHDLTYIANGPNPVLPVLTGKQP